MTAKKKKTAKRTKRTPKRRSAPDWAPRFLVALADSANIRASAAAAGIGRTAVYQRRDSDAEFAAAMAAALDDACDDLELEGRRRARHGVDEPVVYQGELMGVWHDAAGNVVNKDTPGAIQTPLTIKKYSDVLLIFLLKAHRPEKYRDNVRHEHSGPGGGPIPAKVEHDLAADLAPYAAALGALIRGELGAGGGEVRPDGPP